MADRKKILWGITDDEERLFLSKMCDIAEKSEVSHKVMFSRFLNPGERMLIESRMADDFSFSFFGGFDDAERTIVAFGNAWEDIEYPLCAVKIECRGKKALSHRDYLGSVLSLGIKREHVGDILVKDTDALMFLTDEISDFVLMNLNRIASQTIKIYVTDDLSQFETQRRFKEADITVSSMRLDCVLSAVTGRSRSQSVSLIEEGLCNVNYSTVKNVRAQVKDGDIIAVRGFGKCVIETDNALTKKGRIHIKIKKYN